MTCPRPHGSWPISRRARDTAVFEPTQSARVWEAEPLFHTAFLAPYRTIPKHFSNSSGCIPYKKFPENYNLWRKTFYLPLSYDRPPQVWMCLDQGKIVEAFLVVSPIILHSSEKGVFLTCPFLVVSFPMAFRMKFKLLPASWCLHSCHSPPPPPHSLT